MRIRSDDERATAAHRFRERVGCESVLITRGEHGMWLLAPDGDSISPPKPVKSPTSPARATPSLRRWRSAWPAGGSLQQAARLANRAAGLAVSHFGPTAVSAVELREALQAD